MRLEYDRGTLLVHPGAQDLPPGLTLPGCTFDRRVKRWRAPAHCYRELLTALHRAGVEVDNQAGGFEELDLRLRLERDPFPYQSEAVSEWWAKGRRGVVVLPTGTGKTYVAQLIIERVARACLIVVPTLDLMQQWYGELATAFDVDVGLIGGGYYEPQLVTVTTYDSAYIHMERLGNRNSP